MAMAILDLVMITPIKIYYSRKKKEKGTLRKTIQVTIIKWKFLAVYRLFEALGWEWDRKIPGRISKNQSTKPRIWDAMCPLGWIIFLDSKAPLTALTLRLIDPSEKASNLNDQWCGLN